MTGVRRSVAEIQFSETLWWILVVMSFHSPGMTCCWNGDSAYTTAFMRTGTFPILLLSSPRRFSFLLGVVAPAPITSRQWWWWLLDRSFHVLGFGI
jgi:hypothetical protein